MRANIALKKTLPALCPKTRISMDDSLDLSEDMAPFIGRIPVCPSLRASLISS